MKSIHKLTLSLLIEKYSNESQLSNKVIELFEKLETFQVNILVSCKDHVNSLPYCENQYQACGASILF